MWTHGPLEHRIDAELGKFVPNSLPEGLCVGDLVGIGVQEVNVEVEAAAGAVGDGIGECRVC